MTMWLCVIVGSSDWLHISSKHVRPAQNKSRSKVHGVKEAQHLRCGGAVEDDVLYSCIVCVSTTLHRVVSCALLTLLQGHGTCNLFVACVHVPTAAVNQCLLLLSSRSLPSRRLYRQPFSGLESTQPCCSHGRPALQTVNRVQCPSMAHGL